MSKKTTRSRRARRRLGSPFGRSEPRGVDEYVLAWEDACLPVELPFTPPLVELGWPGPFEYHWQLLTRAFSLPDPAAFPAMTTFSAEDAAVLNRYATVCGEVAGSAALRHRGGTAVSAIDGHVTYEPVPTRSAFEGLATRFRQLHFGEDGSPGFDSVASILNRHALLAEDAQCVERIGVLSQWNRARDTLRHRPLKNVVARSMLRQRGHFQDEANYEEVRPDDVFAAFECGRLIAVDGTLSPYQEHLFMVSALGLCHLYFGYALLVRSALGGD